MKVLGSVVIDGDTYRFVETSCGCFIGKQSAVGDSEERGPIEPEHVPGLLVLASEEPSLTKQILEDVLEEARRQQCHYARVEWDFVPYIRCRTVYVPFERNRSRH